MKPVGLLTEQGAREIVESILADSVAGWNGRDIDRFMAIYLDSPDTIFVGGANISIGFSSIAERYSPYFSDASPREDAKLSLEILDLKVLGADHILLTARNKLDDGAKKPTGISTAIFVRTETGWRILSDHS
jgi:ketosteroid isomerase-like protein